MTTVAVLGLGTSGCGFVLATPPNTTIAASPEFESNSPLKQTPDDEVPLTIPTTVPPPPLAGTNGRSLAFWETVVGNSLLPACDQIDTFIIGGARIANVASTATTRRPTLTRAEQAKAIAEFRHLAETVGDFDDLLASAGTPIDDPAAFDAAVEDLRRLASSEPADGDARNTFQQWSERHQPVLDDLVAKTIKLCPTGLIAQMLAFESTD